MRLRYNGYHSLKAHAAVAMLRLNFLTSELHGARSCEKAETASLRSRTKSRKSPRQ